LEQQDATGKNQQAAVAQHAPQAGSRGSFARVLGTLDIAHANAGKRQDRWRSKYGGQEEHGLTGDKRSACTHGGRGDAVAYRGEARIAAEPRAERSMANQTEADRGNDRPQHAAGRRVQDTRSHHNGEIRPDRERKRAQTNRRHRQPGNQPRRADGIDQRTAGHLAGQGDQAARGQDQADIELRPLMRGQIDRDERTKAGLNVRKEEREPVKTARTRLRRRTRGCGRRLLPCHRRRNTDVGAAVEPTAVKLKC
jgi:hypothetical protein